MRMTLCVALVLTLSVFTTAFCRAEKKEGNAKPSPKFEQGVVVGNRLIAVDSRGHLVTRDLAWGGGRDYGILDRKLGKYIDVAGDKACVTTPKEICEVDLSSGKVIRSAKHTTGNAGVGFIDANRVFAHNGLTLEIIDLENGKTLQSIDLSKGKRRTANWFDGEPLIAHARSGNLLFVAQPFQRDVAIVDLDQGKLVREIKTTDFGWATGVHVAGNKLFTRQMMVSYGFVTEQLCVVDLETGKSQTLQFPRDSGKREPQLNRPGAMRTPIEIVANVDVGFLLAAHQGVYQYDANGKLVRKSAEPLLKGERLLATHKGLPLVAGPKTIRNVKMSPVKIAAE